MIGNKINCIYTGLMNINFKIHLPNIKRKLTSPVLASNVVKGHNLWK
jgi:hypothetical protein